MKKPLSAPRFYLLIWLACVSLAQPFAALAQTNAPAELPPAAQEAMDRGVIAAKNQDYLLAIRFFADARKAAPTQPVLLFNLGLAESKIAGRELRAMAWFGAYLAASPDAANAGAVRTQIKELDVKNLSSLTRLLRTTEDAAKQLVEPASYIPGSIAVLWTKSGDLESAFQFANSIQGYPKSRAQAAIAGAQAKAGDFAGAQRTADSIQDASHKDLAQNAIAVAQAKAGDIAGAQRTVARMQDASDKDLAQNAIGDAQIKAGDIAGAQKTADSMTVWMGSSSGLEDTLRRDIAQVLAKAFDFAGAQKTADRIRDGTGKTLSDNAKLNFHAKAKAHWSIAVAQAEAGDIAGAQRTVARMQDDSNWEGDAQWSIVRAQLRIGDIVGAQKTADSIRNTRGKSGAQQDVIAEAREAEKNTSEAERITKRAVKMAEHQSKAGDIAGAQRTADGIQDEKARDEAHKAIAWSQAYAGDIAGAQKTADGIQDARRKDSARQTIAWLQARAGDIAGAQRTADSIQDASDKDLAQKAIAEAQAKAGDFAGAQKTVDSIRSEYSKGNTQKDIAQVQAEAGDFVAAQMTVDGIQRADVKVEAQKAIAEAQAISVAKWTEKNEALLSKSVFLDLAAHLKSLPANDADRVFRGLLVTAEQITDARMVITEMLKQQTQQSAKP